MVKLLWGLDGIGGRGDSYSVRILSYPINGRPYPIREPGSNPANGHGLAQFLKRVGLDDYRRLSVDPDEAWTMLEAGERVRKALADAGYAPR